MKIIRSISQMQSLSLSWRHRGRSVGFVPTMGALHEGHLSLLKRARRENDVLAVSIFVNPAQFGPKEDFKKYPRPFARDAALCRGAGADVLFSPGPGALYPAGFQTWVDVEEVSKPLEGEWRPGHFRGVATVVAKLFNVVQPSRAYFGQKDFQQLRVIRRMAADLNMPGKVIACPTVRERGGLALSSRNAYLSAAERAAARGISRALRAAGEVIKSSGSPSKAARAGRSVLRGVPGARVEYFEAVDPDTFRPLRPGAKKALIAAAVRLGAARLIDNITVGVH
jgi:pantoate--beta-alanine ligase